MYPPAEDQIVLGRHVYFLYSFFWTIGFISSVEDIEGCRAGRLLAGIHRTLGKAAQPCAAIKNKCACRDGEYVVGQPASLTCDSIFTLPSSKSHLFPSLFGGHSYQTVCASLINHYRQAHSRQSPARLCLAPNLRKREISTKCQKAGDKKVNAAKTHFGNVHRHLIAVLQPFYQRESLSIGGNQLGPRVSKLGKCPVPVRFNYEGHRSRGMNARMNSFSFNVIY